jgi:hypothetical protein
MRFSGLILDVADKKAGPGHPLLPQNLHAAIISNMDALERAEDEKHKKFDQDCKTWDLEFKTFAMTTFGGFGEEALSILKNLIHITSQYSNEPISNIADNIYKKLSITLQRDIARSIIARQPKKILSVQR